MWFIYMNQNSPQFTPIYVAQSGQIGLRHFEPSGAIMTNKCVSQYLLSSKIRKLFNFHLRLRYILINL